MKKNKVTNILPIVLVLFIMGSLFLYSSISTSKTLNYNEFVKQSETTQYKELNMSIGGNVIKINGKMLDDKQKEQSFNVVLPKSSEHLKLVDELIARQETKVVVKDAEEVGLLYTLVIQFLPIILMLGLGVFFLSRLNNSSNNKAFDFAKSKAQIQTDVKVRFKDVAGCDEEKEEVKEIIDYLKDPKRFTDMGARIPKGMLMVGPPGTGKTLLAKAVAGEANVPFFSISGSDFVEMFVGTGASRVRDMFKTAMKHAPCIVFIDEIDAVGRQRGAGMGGGNDEREQTLNQLLVEMDGMGENKGIVIIAATNRPDVLDPALLRSGRFDRQITVSLPDVKGRHAILKVHARNKKLSKEIDLEALAKRTPGFSGADLENVLNESAILAVRDRRKLITMADLDEAIDRVMMGPAKKSKKYSEREKRLVAYHEAGHAVIGLKLESADMVEKITIIPRGTAGGYNLMTPREEKMFPTKKDFLGQITGLMGGRVAEDVMFEEVSAGASNDIQKATKIAKAMVRSWGMSSLGPIQYDDGSGNVFLGRDYSSGSNYSGEIAFEIDKEVRRIINECYAEAKRIIIENKDLLILIAETLIEEETITSEGIQNLVKFGSLNDPNATENVTEEVLETEEVTQNDDNTQNDMKPIDLSDVLSELTKKKESD